MQLFLTILFTYIILLFSTQAIDLEDFIEARLYAIKFYNSKRGKSVGRVIYRES